MAMQAMVPPTSKEKDKIIGGKIDINQLIWISCGLILGAIFLAIYSMTIGFMAGVLLCIPFLLIGCPFAFVKKDSMPLFTYLKRRKEFEKGQKFIKINVRRDY